MVVGSEQSALGSAPIGRATLDRARPRDPTKTQQQPRQLERYGCTAVALRLGQVQVYSTKTPPATATPFLARLLRVSKKDPGFRGFRPRRSQLA